MRELLNAYKGYIDQQNEFREQIRLVSYYSFVGHLKSKHNLKAKDLYSLPCDQDQVKPKKKSKGLNKKEQYKLLEKWSK